MSNTLEIKGLEKFRRGLQDLPVKVAKRVLRKSIKEGAELIKEEAKIKAHVLSGALRESLEVKMKSGGPFEAVAWVQSTKDYNNKHSAWYAALVEYGSAYVIIKKKKVIATGRIPPKPFMRPAFESARSQAEQLIADELSKNVLKEWKKLSG